MIPLTNAPDFQTVTFISSRDCIFHLALARLFRTTAIVLWTFTRVIITERDNYEGRGKDGSHHLASNLLVHVAMSWIIIWHVAAISWSNNPQTCNLVWILTAWRWQLCTHGANRNVHADAGNQKSSWLTCRWRVRQQRCRLEHRVRDKVGNVDFDVLTICLTKPHIILLLIALVFLLSWSLSQSPAHHTAEIICSKKSVAEEIWPKLWECQQ